MGSDRGEDPHQLYVTTGRETKVLARPVDERYRNIYYITYVFSQQGWSQQCAPSRPGWGQCAGGRGQARGQRTDNRLPALGNLTIRRNRLRISNRIEIEWGGAPPGAASNSKWSGELGIGMARPQDKEERKKEKTRQDDDQVDPWILAQGGRKGGQAPEQAGAALRPLPRWRLPSRPRIAGHRGLETGKERTCHARASKQVRLIVNPMDHDGSWAGSSRRLLPRNAHAASQAGPDQSQRLGRQHACYNVKQ